MSAYSWTWEAHGLRIHASRFQPDRGGLSVECVIERQRDTDWHRFSSHRLSLTSLSQRRDFVREMSEAWEGPDWKVIARQLCDRALLAYRTLDTSLMSQGETVPEIDTYILNPFLFQGHPSIIFGPGDSGKSMLGVLASLLLVQGGHQAGLAAGGGFTQLYLDWERAFSTFDSRIRALCLGHPELAPAKTRVCYQRLHRPLRDCVEDVATTIAERGADVLIIDSLGMASGGNLNDSDPATGFYDALGSFGLPSLIIGHTAKGTEGEKTVYGNSYFTFLATMAWEIAADHVEESSTLTLGLYNKKNNLGARRKPLGFSIAFQGDVCTVSEASLEDSPTLGKKLSRSQRIKSLLGDRRLRGLLEIAETLNDDQASILVELNRYKGKLWEKVGDEWGIL